LDPLIPIRSPKVDVWFGFNSLACARGLWARRVGRAQTVVYWCVDFVPDRFGHGILSQAYDRLDRLCCRRADARFELSDAARRGREARHRMLERDLAAVRIVPMGAWTDRVPIVAERGIEKRRIVFLGHLVPRQGVQMLLEAIAILRDQDVAVTADIIGGGPLEGELRRRARELDLGEMVRFHGFVVEHTEVERLLSEASIAVAPYEPSGDNFTRFADPGKLKAYLAAGLPIVLTPVPPNADELAVGAGAEVVDFAAPAIADALERGLSDDDAWRTRRLSALAYSKRFDWSTVLTEALGSLGLAA
jgi:glycosyltransferase involved in cell wall biosynthesis